MSVQFFPLAGAKASAGEMQTVMAASVVHLFQSTLTPDPSTPDTGYDAAEATYTGYTSLTLTTWNDPILAPGTGYMIGSPLVQFETDPTSVATTNIIGGCWVEDSTGIPRITVIFDAPIPMQISGQGIPLNFVWLFPTS